MLAPHLTLLADSILSPLTILILCLIAGVGTILLLPGRRESTNAQAGQADPGRAEPDGGAASGASSSKTWPSGSSK